MSALKFSGTPIEGIAKQQKATKKGPGPHIYVEHGPHFCKSDTLRLTTRTTASASDKRGLFAPPGGGTGNV